MTSRLLINITIVLFWSAIIAWTIRFTGSP